MHLVAQEMNAKESIGTQKGDFERAVKTVSSFDSIKIESNCFSNYSEVTFGRDSTDPYSAQLPS